MPASDLHRLLELGRAAKTIFLAGYLHSPDLRREIFEGLQVAEAGAPPTPCCSTARTHRSPGPTGEPSPALFWNHVNPYGRFELGMDGQLGLELPAVA
jgi:hypothetical protein